MNHYLSDPSVFKAIIRSELVVDEVYGAPEESASLVRVLASASQNFYEIGPYVKKTIYGAVMQGVILEPLRVPSSSSAGRHRIIFRRTPRDVAIKIFSKEMIMRGIDKSREKPLQEMALLQFLSKHPHEHILGQIECCADDQHLFSVSPWVHGGELFDHVVSTGKMDEAEAYRVFHQIACAVHHLHDLRVAHRDLSLENILYDSSRREVQVIDFGMAQGLFHRPSKPQPISHRRGATLDVKNDFSGKKNYLAPEIVRGDAFIDPMACDRWALGIILLYLLLGFPPIERAGTDDPRYTCIVVDKELRRLVEHWGVSDLSDDVLNLVEGLLQEEAGERLSLDEIWEHPWMRKMAAKERFGAQSAAAVEEMAVEEVADERVEEVTPPTPSSERHSFDSDRPASSDAVRRRISRRSPRNSLNAVQDKLNAQEAQDQKRHMGWQLQSISLGGSAASSTTAPSCA